MKSAADGQIRQAQVSAPDAATAVRRLHEALAGPDVAQVLFFCTPDLELDQVGAEMARCFGTVPVAGCTTAGEIGPAGYRTGTLSGLSLPAAQFAVASRSFGNLHGFGASQAHALVRALVQELDTSDTLASLDPVFAYLLIDGLAGCEEPVTRALQSALGTVPLVGGSAADGTAYGHTGLYRDGGFEAGLATLMLVRTRLPFRPFMTQHFVATEQRVVVTAADAAQRIVHEIDGLPAALAYARLIGVDPARLAEDDFADAPMAALIGGMSYVRSVSKALPDGSLLFHCAIDEGMVLRITHGVDLLDNLEHTFTTLDQAIGPLQLVLGCDCILRRREIEHNSLQDRVGALMQRHRVVGFNTYGEQYRGVHVNQTFTGVAIGSLDGGAGG
jgi:hypothetical protein